MNKIMSCLIVFMFCVVVGAEEAKKPPEAPQPEKQRVEIPQKLLEQMRLEERAFHLRVAVEEPCDDAFFENYAAVLQNLSDVLWQISDGKFYIEKISFKDNSWEGRFIIPKGAKNFELLSGRQTGVGAQCRNPNTNGWFVLSPGRPKSVIIVIHEFLHGVGKLRDEGNCPCIMRGRTSGEMFPICSKATHKGAGSSCWDLLLERWPNAKDANPAYAPKSLPPKLQIAEKFHQKQPDGVKDKILKIDSLTERGIIMIEARQNEKALAFFTKALELDPKSPAPLYNIACIYAVSKNNEKAMEFLKRALEAGFDDFDLLKNDEDFKALQQDKRFNEMLDTCQKALPGYRQADVTKK